MSLIRRNSQSVFTRRLYPPSALKTVTLLKREIDQHEGTVTAYLLFRIRRSMIKKTGEALQDDMDVENTCVFLIPRTELERNNLSDINVLDRILETRDHPSQQNTLPLRYWQPESNDKIDVKLFEDYVRVECRRVDPPNAETLAGHPTPPVPGA